ncbi:MAG: undecaprenyldiphospho-muramoylpentapeptide beta-N-acetylglucosaminyltransferase [Ferruginibacter sp.]
MTEEDIKRKDEVFPVKGPRSIIIAGGGTGGHIFPAIAIANAIKKIAPDTRFLFIGARGKMEMDKVPQAGYEIKGLEIAGFNRSSLIKNIGLPYKLLKSFYQVRTIFKSFKPEAVIGVGGYSSFPVLRFAQSQGIKTFIHESNSFAGRSNIFLGRRATKIFVASDGMEKFFPAHKILISGNPVRQSIAGQTITKEEALKHFAFSEDKKTVLSMGGSLGAKNINEAIDKDIMLFEENGIQLIWQTGKPYQAKAADRVQGMNNVYANDFIAQMEYAYTAADMVISRSGAMAVAELCLVKKPVIFVPYPFAAEDHQTVNAQSLVNKEAAIMIRDNEALNKLVPSIISLSKNEELQESLKNNIGKLGVGDADVIIAKEILKALVDS